MFYDLNLAWQNLRARPVQTFVTMAVISLAIALSVAVTLLNDGLRQGIIRASDGFGVLVIGAKGSAQALVLSTILLQGLPVGNIPQAIFTRLQNDNRVALAIPIAMGDNVGGARIIGTNADFFTLRPTLQALPAFQLASGRLFTANFEAVLGSTAAQQLGLRIGDHFLPQHGVERGLVGDEHHEPQTVVGILQPSHSPYDNAVFTNVASVIEIHQTPEEHKEANSDERIPDQVTAILVKPKGFIEANQLWREFYMGTEAQAAFPGQELAGLFDLLNQGQQLLLTVGYLTAVMAALTLFLAIYSATIAREQLIAIMRSLGARRLTVFRMVLFETLLVAILGALVGRLLGYGTAMLIANQIAQRSAIPISIRYLPQLEPFLWLVPCVIGIIAGLLPAFQAYRVNVVDKLFPT